MELLDRVGLIMVICAMLVTVKKDADYLVKTQRKSRDSHEIAKTETKTQMKTQNSNLTFEKADEPQTDCHWK